MCVGPHSIHVARGRQAGHACSGQTNTTQFEGESTTAKVRNDGKNLLERGRLILETGRRATIRLGSWATGRVSRFPRRLPEISLPVLRNRARRWGPRRCGCREQLAPATSGNAWKRQRFREKYRLVCFSETPFSGFLSHSCSVVRLTGITKVFS